MKILEIHLKNFRGIDRLDLDLRQANGTPLDLVMLAGPNGCGKTSVIEACLMALKQDSFLAREHPNQPYEITVVATIGAEPVTIRRTPGQCFLVGRDGHTRPLNGCLKDQKTFYFSSWRAPKLVGSVGLSTGRGKKPQKTDDNSLWRLKQHLVNRKGAKAYRVSEGEGGRADEIFARINEIWREFYPDRNGRFDAEIVPTEQNPANEDGGEELTFDLLLRDTVHPGGVPVDALSSGEIEVLTMIGTFVTEIPPFDVVFIDEPELHLHPAWHRAIMRGLRKASPGTQFICATHSAEILESVYNYERFTLLPEDDPRVRLTQPK